jgi:hypothetical protein
MGQATAELITQAIPSLQNSIICWKSGFNTASLTMYIILITYSMSVAQRPNPPILQPWFKAHGRPLGTNGATDVGIVRLCIHSFNGAL